MSKHYDLTAHEARDLLQRKEVSSVELTRAVLERIELADYDVFSARPRVLTPQKLRIVARGFVPL